MIDAPILIATVAAGPLIGSFATAAALRWPESRDAVAARSRCDTCSAVLAARDLIPVLSWIALRGRCRRCAAPVSALYPLSELAALAVPVAAAAAVPDTATFAIATILGWTLLALSAMDLRHMMLADAVTVPLIVAGPALAMIGGGDPAMHVAGAALGAVLLAGPALLYRAVRGRDGLGGGDVKLMAAAGAWLGPAALPGVLLVATVSALVCAALLHRRGASDRIPFGPGLALAFFVSFLAGPLELA